MWVAAPVPMFELGRVSLGKSCKMIKTDFWIRLGLKRVINLKAVLGNETGWFEVIVFLFVERYMFQRPLALREVHDKWNHLLVELKE